jgi:DNA-binding NtrC family response regulator
MFGNKTPPLRWVQWKTVVRELLDLVERIAIDFMAPGKPADRTSLVCKLDGLAQKRRECDTFAEGAGTAAERMAISLTLHRTHADAREIADRLCGAGRRFDSATADELHRMCVWSQNEIHRLGCRLAGGTIVREMSEAIARGDMGPHIGDSRQGTHNTPAPPLPEDARLIMEALRGRAMSAKALANELGILDRTLKRRLSELTALKLITNDRKAGGYYRPDAPPPAD